MLEEDHIIIWEVIFLDNVYMIIAAKNEIKIFSLKLHSNEILCNESCYWALEKQILNV